MSINEKRLTEVLDAWQRLRDKAHDRNLNLIVGEVALLVLAAAVHELDDSLSVYLPNAGRGD
jgi:hypothetical protein